MADMDKSTSLACEVSTTRTPLEVLQQLNGVTFQIEDTFLDGM